MSTGLLLTATPPGNHRLDNPYTPTWPRSGATTSSLLPPAHQPRQRSPAALPAPSAPPSASNLRDFFRATAIAGAETWNAEPADASSSGAGGRSARTGGARSSGTNSAAAGTKKSGVRGGRSGSGTGGGGDGDEDGDDGRGRKRQAGGKDAADAIDVPSDDSDDEGSESEDGTPAPKGGERDGRGRAASGQVAPADAGAKLMANWRGAVEERAADKPPARYFGTFTKKREGFREPPPTRRPGMPRPVPREEREAPWGETWWADRMASFDFGETIFAAAYQSLQITADLLRNDEGKRPKMAPPKTLPWQSRFGLPQPENMPLMKAFDKDFESKGVWDLKGPLPELFGKKDGEEVNPLAVFPLHGDVNLPTPPPEIEETTKSKKGKQRATP